MVTITDMYEQFAGSLWLIRPDMLAYPHNRPALGIGDLTENLFQDAVGIIAKRDCKGMPCKKSAMAGKTLTMLKAI